MRATRFIAFVLIQIPFFCNGQVGNEWINAGQIYYKIPVGKDGMYKVTKAELSAVGFPVNLDPRRYQLYHRGVEQAITISGQADSQFDDSDYIEFYGKRNDGTLDAELYKPASNQPHRLYNLYNDTAYYFLTYHPSLQGKRITNFTQSNTGSLPVETYHQVMEQQLFTNSYSGGETINSYVQYTAFDKGEGWSGPVLRENTETDIQFTTLINQVPAGGVPSLEIQLLGRGSNNHKAEIYVGPNSGSLRMLTSAEFSGFEPFTYTSGLNWTDLSVSGNAVVRVRVVGTSGADFVSVSYARMVMPQQLNMTGLNEKLFTLPENTGGKSYIEIVGAPASAMVFDVTDENELLQIGTSTSATLNAVVNNTQQSRKLFVTNQTLTTGNIRRVNFRSMTSVRPEFVVITHPNFKRPAAGVSNPVKAYCDYRASAAGGGYDTLSVTIDQLYNQFSYGESTPVAIYRFLKFLETKRRPDYLLLIGKGLDVNYAYYRFPTAYTTIKDFVPSAGYPASDMVFSVGLDGNSYAPSISTGRLSVTSSEQVVYYLNKVKEQEAKPYDDLWRKRVLHLSGGLATGEPETFKGYMKSFGVIAEAPYFGASVSAIAKNSLNVQELINVSDQVNSGLNLITFFGHSAISATDFEIGFVTDSKLGYNNKGKYPMLLLNGCNAGSFFTNNILMGEDWINAADRGALGFIAHTSFGLVSTLKRYSDFFYSVAYGDSTFMKMGVGDIQKEVARRYLLTAFPSAQNVTQVQQMLLLGDPAVKVFGARKSDFAINPSSVSAQTNTGKSITTSTSSFDLHIVTRNFGRALNDSLVVSVKRIFTDNTSITFSKKFAPVFYQDTLVFPILNSDAKAGVNTFEITLDADFKFSELNEANNTTSFSLFIPGNGTKNLFPTDFAIENTLNPVLTFQSSNLLDSLRYFELEIDTSHLFNSGFKKSMLVNAKVLVKQVIALLSTDSLTYYWRTRLKYPSEDENKAWEGSSFTYISNSLPGWGQLDFPQYEQNEFDALLADQNVRRLSFTKTVTSVLIKTFGSDNTSPYTEVSAKLNGAEYNLDIQSPSCRNNTINLIAFNRVSTVAYPGLNLNPLDARTCGRWPKVIVNFAASEVFNSGSTDMIEYINNVTAGDSVILFSIGNPQFSGWNAAVITKLGELGISASQMAGITDGEPVVIYAKKGAAAGTARIYTSELSPKAEQELIVNRSITGLSATGKMTTKTIGPAQQWSIIKYNAKEQINDLIKVDVYGVKNNGQEELLFEDISTNKDISGVDAKIYSLLRLRYHTTDDVNLTPAQLSYWLVEYQSLAEGIAIHKASVSSTELSEGEVWKDTYGFVNISNRSFTDSLTVKYNVINKLSNVGEEKVMKIKAPAPGDTTTFLLEATTLNRSGLNDVRIAVNNPMLVSELFIDNNVILNDKAFLVTPDYYKPSLSVYVDGRLLRNGDFVSPDPIIDIRLWDENKLILKKDTLGMVMLLKYPCEETCESKAIHFTRPDIRWTPATASSPFTITFTPLNLTDGIYELEVLGEDSRGNKSGIEPYSVTFEVKNEQTISVTQPYPNPSTGKITFTFVITGKEKPAEVFLEVFNALGEVVKILKLPLMKLHSGTNFYAIDFSNELTNGLYVYRLRADQEVRQRGQFLIMR